MQSIVKCGALSYTLPAMLQYCDERPKAKPSKPFFAEGTQAYTYGNERKADNVLPDTEFHPAANQ